MKTAALAAGTPVPMRQDASIIGLVGLAHASSHFSHLLLPLMFPVFMKQSGLNHSQPGLMMTAFFVVSSVGQASGGFLVDREGARPVLFGSLAVFVLACLAAAVSTSYAMLLLVSALAGFDDSPFHPVDFTVMNQRVSTGRLGYAFSVHGLTGNLDWAAAPLFFAILTSLYDWRFAYFVAAAPYAAILPLLRLGDGGRASTHHTPGIDECRAGADQRNATRRTHALNQATRESHRLPTCSRVCWECSAPDCSLASTDPCNVGGSGNKSRQRRAM